MKKITIKLEYKCYPMWVYENGFAENDLAEELRCDKIIDDKLLDIQNKYDSLFVDDGIEFCYKGFQSNDEKRLFQKQVNDAVAHIKDKTGGAYSIETLIDYDEL